MALTWPLLLIPILAIIVVGVWFARRPSRHGWQGELPLLARSFRLTELPEYQRALRLHTRLSAVALVFAIVVFIALLGSALRPTRTYDPQPASPDTPYVDIMLCFGPMFEMQFAESLGMVPLMVDLQAKVNDFGNQRIGMTHQFYRAFPVTADHRWVSQRFGEIIDVAEQAVVSPNNFRLDTTVFERQSYGGDVRANVVDTLAMCAMGLPAAGADNGRGKMIIFIGDTRLQDDPGRSSFDTTPDPQLYSKAALEKTLESANIQLNTIVPDALYGPPGFIETLVNDTGGQQVLYTEIDSVFNDEAVPPLHVENQEAELSGAVDKILAHPSASALDQARSDASSPFVWDVPNLLLQTALLAMVALAAARLGMRL